MIGIGELRSTEKSSNEAFYLIEILDSLLPKSFRIQPGEFRKDE